MVSSGAGDSAGGVDAGPSAEGHRSLEGATAVEGRGDTVNSGSSGGNAPSRGVLFAAGLIVISSFCYGYHLSVVSAPRRIFTECPGKKIGSYSVE